jgi:hypothetical protein
MPIRMRFVFIMDTCCIRGPLARCFYRSARGSFRRREKRRAERTRGFSDCSLGTAPDSQGAKCKRIIRIMTAKRLNEIATRQRAELYCELHPGSPSAVRMPKLFVRSGVWIALLGHTIRDGIAGFGPSIEAALRAFDAAYLNALRQPGESSALDRAA